jgi:hypothetical protein
VSSYAGQDLFGSGPHAFRPGPWRRATQRRGFAGVRGERVLDLGLRSRTIRQTGRLTAETAGEVAALIDAIEAAADGAAHELIDNHGRSFPRAILERFEPITPLLRGRRLHCEYEIDYRELP